MLYIDSKVVLLGDLAIARHLISSTKTAYTQLELSEIDVWNNFSLKNIPTDKAYSLDAINDFLQLRTFFVGNSLSLADISVFYALKSAALESTAELHPHFNRWYNHVSGLSIIKQAEGRLSADARRALKVSVK